MAQTRYIGQSVQHLGNTHFVRADVLDTEVTSGQSALDTILNRSRFDNFINVGLIDDAQIIIRGFPRASIDLFDDLLLHIFHQLVEVITEQVVQQSTCQINALIDIRIAIILFDPFKTRLQEAIHHITKEHYLLDRTTAMRKQIIAQNIQGEFVLLLCAGLFVHINRRIHCLSSNMPDAFFLSQITIRINYGCL